MHIAGYTGFQSYGQKPYSTNKPGLLKYNEIYKTTDRKIDETNYLENFNRNQTMNAATNKGLTPQYYKDSLNLLKENKLKKLHKRDHYSKNNYEVKKEANKSSNKSNEKILDNLLYDIKYIGDKKFKNYEIKEVHDNTKNLNNVKENIRINKYPIQINNTGLHESKLPYDKYNDQIDNELYKNYEYQENNNYKDKINNKIHSEYKESFNSIYSNTENKGNLKNSNQNIDKYKNPHHTKANKNITEYDFQYTSNLKDDNMNDELKKGTTKLSYHIPGYSGYLANELNNENIKNQNISEKTRKTFIKENILENYNLKMPGYSGYVPKNIENKNNIKQYQLN